MKTKAFTAFLVLFVMSMAAALTSAHAPSTNGTYRFVLEDGLTKSVEFNATTDERGVTTGQMTFRDEAGIVERDAEGNTVRAEDPPLEFYMTAYIDTLKIENNRAVMGGTVRDSSHPGYIGQWVQLVVEDNGDGREVPDKLSWCFCQPEPSGWIPADAEVPRDDGAYWHWWVTDAELRDDPGIPSVNIIPGNRIGCPAFPVASYELPDARGEGQIQVQP